MNKVEETERVFIIDDRFSKLFPILVEFRKHLYSAISRNVVSNLNIINESTLTSILSASAWAIGGSGFTELSASRSYKKRIRTHTENSKYYDLLLSFNEDLYIIECKYNKLTLGSSKIYSHIDYELNEACYESSSVVSDVNNRIGVLFSKIVIHIDKLNKYTDLIDKFIYHINKANVGAILFAPG